MSAPSSSSRPSVESPPSIPSSPTRHPTNPAAHRDNGDDRLSAAHVHAHDFAQRKKSHRQSGGFLLNAAFPTGPRNRRSHHSSHAESLESEKGKRSSRVDRKGADQGQHELQDEGHGSEQAQHGQLQVEKTRNNGQGNMVQPQAIDPNQLVHMALNLSESRRRNISTSQLLAAQSRLTSSTHREGSSSAYGAGHSLRQYLNEPRRVSRNISPMGNRSSPSRQMSTSMQRSTSMTFANSQLFNPSHATLARVDKARACIELRMEYLRMLDYLPPLKPDANAPGNFIITSNNVPGSPQAQLTRMPSYAGKQYNLGRPYNPLQYIRNRRTRARERRSLHHSSDDFLDVDQVREWVDRIEKQSKHPSYREQDRVQLPKIHNDLTEHIEPNKSIKSHKGWICSPEELLADAYWLEQGDNKTLIENRYGGKVFPEEEAPKPEFSQPRASKEHTEKHRKGLIEGFQGILADPMTGDESEHGSERGRKRRLLPTIRAESPKGGRHHRRGSRFRMKEDADSSGSDVGSEKRKPRLALDTEHNTGPLALLLEQHAKEARAKTPAFMTPDTPDKWGRKEFNQAEAPKSRNSLEVHRPGEGFTFVKDRGSFKMPPKAHTNPTLSIAETEPRSSFEDLNSTAPTTPLYSKRFPHIGDDFSPPGSRASSQNRKTKRSKLNIFHSHEHSGDFKGEHRPGSAGRDKQQAFWQPNEATQHEKHPGAEKVAGTGAVRNLLGHRKNDSVNSLPSPDRLRRKDTQEPHSAVTRFFKGVRHEGTKVGEFIFRRDKPDDSSDTETLSDRNSVDFDTDTSAKKGRHKRPPLSPAISSTIVADRTSTKQGRFNIELPTFRPVNQSQFDESKDLNVEHHIVRQTRDRKKNRSPRFDKLAPPPMDLGSISGNSSTTSLNPVRSHSHDRLNERLAHPGGANPVGLPPTALRKMQASDVADPHGNQRRPTLEGKRHWSITNDREQHLRRKTSNSAVTQAEIARVRAIFLSSGIKARELSRRAYVSRSSAPDFLTRAAATAKTELFPVPRKEEHVLAARILMKDLEFSTRSLHVSLEEFRQNVVKQVLTQVSQMQSHVDSDLMPRVLDGGDKVVRVTSEVSGQGPLEVQQITDEIDRMLRARRRKMRWVRRLGWGTVEWAVVAFMWWLWLIVVLLRCVKKIFAFGWGTVRWVLWI